MRSSAIPRVIWYGVGPWVYRPMMVPTIDPIAWPPSDWRRIHDHHSSSEPRRFKRRGDARDARSDDADVGGDKARARGRWALDDPCSRSCGHHSYVSPGPVVFLTKN